MEWMLQVVDDLDDTVNAVLHRCLGLGADLGMVIAAGVFVGAIAGGLVLGAVTTVMCTAGGLLGVALAFRLLRGRQSAHLRVRRA